MVHKEVGFLWAINWSLALIVVYPAIAGLGLQALREMAALPERLSRRRMLVDADFRAARQGFADTEFRRALRLGAMLTGSVKGMLTKTRIEIRDGELALIFEPGVAHLAGERVQRRLTALGDCLGLTSRMIA